MFLARQLRDTTLADEVDFSERLDRVLMHVEKKLKERDDLDEKAAVLSNPMVTEILHAVDLKHLQRLVEAYVKHKESPWVLVDNLDKGWPALGVTEDETGLSDAFRAP